MAVSIQNTFHGYCHGRREDIERIQFTTPLG